jgi:anthranilate synthase/aminodeoxychorismate synthase-like glutamine amidotransferase
VRVLILDNDDSFTWNLVQAVESLGACCQVHRSHRIGIDEIEALTPDRIILSPGPFGPEQTGVCREAVRCFSGRIPILGVCLGMQVIAVSTGARVSPSGNPVHGKAHPVYHDGKGLFAGLPSPFRGARYHSLQVEADSAAACLEITARTESGVIMGCRVSGTRTEGVLFHPESFLTEHGPRLLGNFLAAESRVV